MRDSILEKLIKKSHFSTIKIEPIDLTEQQDEMLAFLLYGCIQKTTAQETSVLITIPNENQAELLPLSQRKKKLYETRLLEKKELKKESSTKLEDTIAENQIIPITLRKRLLYERACAG